MRQLSCINSAKLFYVNGTLQEEKYITVHVFI